MAPEIDEMFIVPAPFFVLRSVYQPFCVRVMSVFTPHSLVMDMMAVRLCPVVFGSSVISAVFFPCRNCVTGIVAHDCEEESVAGWKMRKEIDVEVSSGNVVRENCAPL